jgi:hypothetical protein
MHTALLKFSQNCEKYDIIFAGAGLSALSLATRMVKMPFFQKNTIDRSRQKRKK